MSGHLHDDTSLYYITFFVERYISKTSSLLSTIQVIRHVNNTIIAFDGYYYTRRFTTNVFNSRMWLVRQHLHGFINPRPPLRMPIETIFAVKGMSLKDHIGRAERSIKTIFSRMIHYSIKVLVIC